MSVHGMEMALYDITTKGSVRRRFVAEPSDVLSRYGLGQGERAVIEALDVRSMLSLGVSPMLTFGLWMCVRGPQALPEYLRAATWHCGEGA
jgi:hypothetical protein